MFDYLISHLSQPKANVPHFYRLFKGYIRLKLKRSKELLLLFLSNSPW
jgi:hypothetical protein